MWLPFRMVAPGSAVQAARPHIVLGAGQLGASAEPGPPQSTDAGGTAHVCGPGPRGAQSWPKNQGLEPQAPARGGPRSEPPSFWGPIGEGAPHRGWPTLPASLVQEDAAPRSLPPLDLFRQLRRTLEMDQIWDLTKIKTNLAAPAKPSTPTHTHPSRAPQSQNPRLPAGPPGWRVVVAMVTTQASGSCCWRGGCPRGLLGCQALPLHLVTLVSE